MIRVGICGYGNLGKGVEAALAVQKDMQLEAVFTRRDPKTIFLKTDHVGVYPMDEILQFKDRLDVLILCGGSATDLPQQSKELAKHFNIVDSFDTHAKVWEHYQQVHQSALSGNQVAVISTGWDPGMFSLNRLIMEAVLPNGKDYTFWGSGVSQGHSDAIRRIEGVLGARQYTIPLEEALHAVRSGKQPNLTTREKHKRECYVVLKEGADPKVVEEKIKTMPNYFADYDTIVHFISEEELLKNHNRLPHGGFVIRSGVTGFSSEHHQCIEYSLKLDSNPEFTGSVMVAYARAVYRLFLEKNYGCKTVFDIAPRYLSVHSYEEMLKEKL